MHWNDKNDRKSTNLVASYENDLTIDNERTMLVLAPLLSSSQSMSRLSTNEDFILAKTAIEVKN